MFRAPIHNSQYLRKGYAIRYNLRLLPIDETICPSYKGGSGGANPSCYHPVPCARMTNIAADMKPMTYPKSHDSTRPERWSVRSISIIRSGSIVMVPPEFISDEGNALDDEQKLCFRHSYLWWLISQGDPSYSISSRVDPSGLT